jgi:hypothetical protein
MGADCPSSALSNCKVTKADLSADDSGPFSTPSGAFVES